MDDEEMLIRIKYLWMFPSRSAVLVYSTEIVMTEHDMTSCMRLSNDMVALRKLSYFSHAYTNTACRGLSYIQYISLINY